MHDLPRVMRLPSFTHRKGQPFVSRLVEVNDLPLYRLADIAPPAEPLEQEAPKPKGAGPFFDLGGVFFRRVNDLALAHADQWVTALFPGAHKNSADQWRVPPHVVGRDCEEDISISPHGIRDFGTHDMGDARCGGRTAIDLVIEHGNAESATDAALWLCERMAIDPAMLGWRGAARALTREPTINPDAEAAAGGEKSTIIDPAAPYKVAKLYVDNNFTQNGQRTLHHHRGGFYGWSGSAYPEVADTSIRSGLYAYLDRCVARGPEGERRPVKPNAAMVGNVIDALRAATHVSDAIAPPTWLDHTTDLPAEEMVACANGLLHLPTLGLEPHTPAFFTHNAVDFAFEPQAPEPRHWLAFLAQLWPNDQPAIDTLQELFGLALTGDTRHQKAFLLVGPKRSGKGTIARILTRLIGPDNTVAPTLAGLGTNFGLAPLIGKRVAIISDARLGGRADQAAIAERLLSITGEDSITIDRKFLPAWTGRLQVRFIVLSNELPRLADASGALVSRFIVLVLTTSFYGKEDHGLTDRLVKEMPGILNWSIAGWQRLYLRGHLIQPKSAAEAVQDLEDLGSPISAFLRDKCIVGPERVVEIARLFEVWCNWSKEQGRDRPGTAQTFGRDLRAVLPSIKVIQPRDDYGVQHRQYGGIGLK